MSDVPLLLIDEEGRPEEPLLLRLLCSLCWLPEKVTQYELIISTLN